MFTWPNNEGLNLGYRSLHLLQEVFSSLSVLKHGRLVLTVSFRFPRTAWWVMADSMSASTLSVPWCEEFADSFSSESRFSLSADQSMSLSLIFSAGMLPFSRCSLSTERAKQQTSDLPEGSHTQLMFPASCPFSRDSVATNEQ